jgi:diguanylate cyclase (GGDEF)-like protein
MIKRKERGIGLFWLTLFFQIFFLCLIFLTVNLGMDFLLQSNVNNMVLEELTKRNHLLQLTLDEQYLSDFTKPRPSIPPREIVLPLPRRNPINSSSAGNRVKERSSEMVIAMLDIRIRNTGALTNTRYTVLNEEGIVQFDSLFKLNEMTSQKNMPEIQPLIDGAESSSSIREDEISGEMTIFQSLPLMNQNKLIGITRVSQPYHLSNKLKNNIMNDIRTSLIIALFFIIIILIPLIRIQTNSLHSLEQTAQAIAVGDYQPQQKTVLSWEMKSLNNSMSTMAQKIKSQIDTIERQNKELKEISLIDELTGLGNRRQFNEKLTYDWWLCLRGNRPLSFIIMDIDHFKKYNDTLGHPAGDSCLRNISDILNKTVCRQTDILARIGGEEFGIILPETSGEQAMELATRILKNINDAALPHPSSETAPHVTISLGISSMIPSQKNNKEELLEQADQALYEAKGKGRNRCEYYKIMMN